jgi:anti-sigma regulatory factor (Ser/Thr protein kinase)
MPPAAALGFQGPATPHLACVVRRVVGAFAAANEIAADDLSHFLSALGEAVANAIEHAGADDGIAIEIRIDRKSIVALVQDTGIGFSAAGPEAVRLPAIEAERGRGLAIMRRCSDIFDVRSEPGKGTSVVVGRSLRRHAASAAATVARSRMA